MKEAREINHLQSEIMPGALHHIGSAFMSIWYRDEYKYSILLESCTENGFEYKEYYNHGEKPGFFENIGGSDLYGNYHLSQRRHTTNSISGYMFLLAKNKFNLVFVGEVDFSAMKAHLEREIELIGIRVCDIGVALEGMNKTGIKRPGIWNRLAQKYEFNYPLFSEKFNLALDQISAGALIENNKKNLDLTGNDGTGLAGEGCLNSLIFRFENSKNRNNLSGITLDLSGNNINETVLLNAVVSRKIPSGITFKGLSPEFNLYLCFYTFAQCMTDFPQDYALNKDIMSQIYNLAVQLLQQKTAQNKSLPILPVSNLLDYNFFANPLSLIQNPIIGFDQKSQTKLVNMISDLVSKQLNQRFTYKNQNWVLISADLQNSIKQELETIYGEALINLCPTQKNILINFIREEIPDYSLQNLIGSFTIKKGFEMNFNIVSGNGLEVSGLTGLYYDCISCDLLSLGTATFGLFKTISETLSASKDQLKQTFAERKSQSIALLYNLLASAATPEELSVLNANSKNRNSASMKTLSDPDYKTYCNTVSKTENEFILNFQSTVQ